MANIQLKKDKYKILGVIACVIITIIVVIEVRVNDHNVEFDQMNRVEDPAQLNQARLEAHLPDCVSDFSHPQRGIPTRWASIPTTCLATGAKTTFGLALDGKKTLVNLWAYWCGPCRMELPSVQEYAKKHISQLRVLLVHIDPNDIAGLHLLHKLHISLPCVTDYNNDIRLVLRTPPVVPISILIAADGTVEHIYSQSFATEQEMEHNIKL